jgi:hypothetical protein
VRGGDVVRRDGGCGEGNREEEAEESLTYHDSAT